MPDGHCIICDRCCKELILRSVEFTYLGNKMEHEVPVCPDCGQVYISPELALGKIREVEELLEDK